jgi:dihydroorotate dehydrogenase
MNVFWEKILRPLAFGLEAERAHEIGIKALEMGLASPYYVDNTSFGFGEIERFGLKFPNPLGVAAGFDKNGVVVDQLASLGFGFVEVGTVTYEPQPGNPKPRLFRLPEDRALINRLGFNNDGAVAIADRLAKLKRRCIVGINIGRNKNVSNEEAVPNYVKCLETVLPVADYVAVNVSSPNTSNLRDLQRAEFLDKLLSALQERNTGKPLLVKISPDLSQGQIEAIVEICISSNIAGLIATNTTTSRDGLIGDAAKYGDGGLSGRPLAIRANDIVSMIYRYAKGRLPVIGVGGIFTAEDAFDKIAAGASLVQAYTGFVYGGPSFPKDINRGLARILGREGLSAVDEAVGSAAGPPDQGLTGLPQPL